MFNLKGTVNVVIDLLGYYAPSPIGTGTVAPAAPSAHLYASNTSSQTVLADTVLAFDLQGPTVGITSDVADDAFTVTNAGLYKVSFAVTSVLSSQLNVEVNGLDPAAGPMVFGGDEAPPAAATTGGTAVLALHAGDTITLAIR